jgi:hypothetical protein
MIEVCSAVVLKRSNGGDHNDRTRVKSRASALNIEELLCAKICAKARFGNHPVGMAQCGTSADDRATPMGNIRERSAVYEGRCSLCGLYDVWHQCVS